eukprot:9326979-Heterocapsa_arctica.AAC.1
MSPLAVYAIAGAAFLFPTGRRSAAPAASTRPEESTSTPRVGVGTTGAKETHSSGGPVSALGLTDPGS